MGEPSANRLMIRLLGPFQVRQADRVIIDATWPHSRAKGLLRLLAFAPGRALHREDVIDGLWPDLPPGPANANLRKALHHLRQCFDEAGLSAPVVRASADVLALSPDVETDLDQFRRLASAARNSGRLEDYERALDIHAGELLRDDLDDLRAERALMELHALRAELSFERATLLLAHGRRSEAIDGLERLLRDDPTNEEAHRVLMRLYAHAGMRDRAVRQYQSCCASLKRELDVAPSRETDSLYREIVDGRFTPVAAPSAPLFGRDREVGQVHMAIREALTGKPRCVLLAGEPGIGKTELVVRASHLAELYGFRTVWGRCHEAQGMPAYWPWLQVIRGCESNPRGRGERNAAPHILEWLPGDTGSARIGTRELAESEATRAQLFEGAVRFFRAASDTRPLLIALEDLHWADHPSLLLLRFLVREVRAIPMVIIATYRDAESLSLPMLSETLSELQAQPHTLHVDIPGLDAPDIREFVGGTMNVNVSPDAAEDLAERTGGNPLFVREIVGSLGPAALEGGPGRELSSLHQTPLTVREVIRRRMTRLSRDAQRALSVAAVVGRNFDVTTLAVATGIPAEWLVTALDEAIAHRAVESVPERVGEYQFAHALFRDAIYEDLPVGQRMALHRRIGDALAALPGADDRVAAIAHHYYQAAPLGLTETAAEYAQMAGDQAKRALAYEEAIGHYERAVELRERAGLTDAATEMELLLSLAQCIVWSGQGGEGRETFLRAAEAARRARSGEGLARIAAAYKNIPGRPTASDPILVSLAEEALDALPEDDSPLRAVLLATLGWSLRGTAEYARREALFEEAVSMARRVAEPHALADVLSRFFDSEWKPENVLDRLAAAEEIMAMGRRLQNPRLINSGAYRRLVGLLETGQVAEFDRCLETHWAIAESIGQDDCKAWFMLARCSRAVLEGRFDRAEEYAQQAYQLLERFKDPDAFRIYASQLFAIRWPQGRLAELEPASRMHSPDNGVPGWRISLGLLALEAGNEAGARTEFERFAVTDFDLPHDRTWMICIVILSEICRGLGDVPRASRLYDLLLPYEAYCAVLSWSEVFTGSNARTLGVLATMLHRWDAAERHFEHALAVNAKMGALTWLAQTQFDFAEMLLARARPGDPERAATLLESARRTAEQIGMCRLLEQADALGQPGHQFGHRSRYGT